MAVGTLADSKNGGNRKAGNGIFREELPTAMVRGSSRTTKAGWKAWIPGAVAVLLSFLVGFRLGGGGSTGGSLAPQQPLSGMGSTTATTLVLPETSKDPHHESMEQHPASKTIEAASPAGAPAKGVYLVTGATGRLGSLVYHQLREHLDGTEVRALVRNATKARIVLGCDACDATEGIFVGDVTQPHGLDAALADGTVNHLLIATGGSRGDDAAARRKIHSDSVYYSVAALGTHYDYDASHLRVVLCSSMGTHLPPQDQPSFFQDILYWKLHSEAFLASSGIARTAVIKPCGLTDGAGNNATVVVGHNGTITENTPYRSIDRADVARLMVALALAWTTGRHVRFDACSRPGPSNTHETGDVVDLLESARYPWDRTPEP